MEKWADYGISAVRFNGKGTYIDQVRVHKDKGNAIGDAEIWSREQIVTALEHNYTFITILNGSQGIWSEGQKVNIVHVDGSKYIRTDEDHNPSDNLVNLPNVSFL
ncbi:DUF3892 domain-containing protein [Methanobacterium sp.]|uniref:DUF3892 domain-containing protein n=1 Tax=Methanobacterium sp. TaxID=2164 RepID=UPI003C70C32E